MKRKINSFPFLGVVTRRHRALATLKQNKTELKQNKTELKQNKTELKQNKTKHIPPNLSQIGLLYKQHPALVSVDSMAIAVLHWITI